jgi:hypothetical protein
VAHTSHEERWRVLKHTVEWREVKAALGRFVASKGLYDSTQGFNPISANLLDLGTPKSPLLQPMAETSTRTRTIEERLRTRRNEPKRGRGFLSLGPPESFSFFDRTRTRTRPRTRNFSLPAPGSICEGPQSNKLALIGLKPWAEPYSPFVGATNLPKDSILPQASVGAETPGFDAYRPRGSSRCILLKAFRCNSPPSNIRRRSGSHNYLFRD